MMLNRSQKTCIQLVLCLYEKGFLISDSTCPKEAGKTTFEPEKPFFGKQLRQKRTLSSDRASTERSRPGVLWSPRARCAALPFQTAFLLTFSSIKVPH